MPNQATQKQLIIFFSILLALVLLWRIFDVQKTSQLAPMPQLAERLQLPQRSTSAIPTRSGEKSQLLISIGDITRNQVLTSIRTREGMLLASQVWLSPGSTLDFDFASASYQLSLLDLDNQLIGDDTAYFGLRQLSDVLIASPQIAPPAAERAAPMRAEETAKIEQLLSALGALKNVNFIRNGRMHSSTQAVAHMRRKWEAAGTKISSAQDFIEQIGTRSSSTGQLYQLRYADGRMQNSADFLQAELARIAAQTRV